MALDRDKNSSSGKFTSQVYKWVDDTKHFSVLCTSFCCLFLITATKIAPKAKRRPGAAIYGWPPRTPPGRDFYAEFNFLDLQRGRDWVACTYHQSPPNVWRWNWSRTSKQSYRRRDVPDNIAAWRFRDESQAKRELRACLIESFLPLMNEWQQARTVAAV